MIFHSKNTNDGTRRALILRQETRHRNVIVNSMLLRSPKNEESDRMHIKIRVTQTANSTKSSPPLLTVSQAEFENTNVT
jgi:hypothetical protein